MSAPLIITGLDIGSSKIAAVVAEIDKDGLFRIAAHEFQASKGVSKGAIVNLDEAVDSVSKVLTKIRNKISRRPERICATITGETIKGEISRGMIPLSLRGREITKTDIERSTNVASTIQLPFERDIVHKITQNFSLDDQPPVKNPLGLYASRLACEVYVITASINHIQNIYKCVNNAGYDVDRIVFTGMAKGESILKDEDKKNGAALLDIGATLTELSIFTAGALRELAVIPLGAEDIKGDFKDSIEFRNIAAETKDKVNHFLSKGANSCYITLTGGLAFADGIVEALEENLSYPVKIGTAKDIRGDISGLDSIRAAASIGLARYAQKEYLKKASEDKNVIRRISKNIVEIFNNYF